ncbi:MAG: serine/threonine-protein kinase [Bryobacterales bacterium]|nr:serine/threonine-protein kinase [Bryobacterales bacterium]
MPLSAGDRLGPYEVLSPIGAGGMGEVYKARDTRLDRTVAVKVLTEHIAQREDARARFEREARAVASLNHPNICSLFDIGPGYMVMELIEGETLATRIDKGALPLDQALQFATQIADALDRAHRAGVTHRDIKPQNIMLTRDSVKVLDFGLAKSVAKPGPTEATLTNVLTTEGTVMGTPQYMAPEQFEGKEADARCDVWAFGAVLYDMVTGQKAFQGKSYSSLLGAILSADPAPMAVKPFTPAWLERLVRRCLQKDADDRWQTMRDVVIELKSPPAEVAVAAAKPNRWLSAVAGASTLALLVAGVGWYNATRPAPLRPLMHLNVEIPAATPLARVDVTSGYAGFGGNLLALSPDGARLVLSLRGADGKTRLHTRLLHQSQLTPLAGTENAHRPFFSPGGDWIGFFAEGKLKKIAVEGGAAVTLCDAPMGYGGSWGDDGNIIAALDSRTVLSRIPSAGGTPVPMTKLNAGEVTHRWPQVLPGSQAVLFTAATQAGGGYDDANIEVISLQTGERKTLYRGGFFPRYLAGAAGSTANGHLVYLHQSTLFAVPFDAGRLALAGTPAPILEDVGSTQVSGGDFTFAGNGTLIYLAGKAALDVYPISWVESGGKTAQPLHAPPGRYFTPRFSPDGKRLAFSMETGKGSDIWVKDLDRDTTSRLSFLPGLNDFPVWTPDGKTIVFGSDNPAAPGFYAIRSDGSGEAKHLTTEGGQLPFSFSPDGKRLTIAQRGNGGSGDVFTLPVEADSGPGAPGIRLGKAELFLGTAFNEFQPAFSPDGRWLAYASNESGTFEVYVRPFLMPGGGTGGRWQVSTGGGRWPRWSRDGRELLFLATDNRVMAAGYTAQGDTFAAAKPRVWTEARVRNFAGSTYDIAPDGKRLAAMVADEGEVEKLPASLTFLMNFGDELRRKAPLH